VRFSGEFVRFSCGPDVALAEAGEEVGGDMGLGGARVNRQLSGLG
jgi:hypothetical protein